MLSVTVQPMRRLVHALLTLLLPLAFASRLSSSDASCDALVISDGVLSRTREYFASMNIDSSRQRSFFDVDWKDPRLLYLASQVGGAHIRFGGTGNDYLYYGDAPGLPPCGPTVPYVNECLNASLFEGVTGLAAAAKSGLIFGLSLLPFNATWRPNPYPRPDASWTWDSTNAAALLRMAKATNTPIWGLELGNEDNSKGWSASQQSSAVFALAAVLDDIYGSGADRPVIVGPDPSGFHVPLPDPHSATVLSFISDYVTLTQSLLQAVTHHEYIEISYLNVLNHTFLDSTRNIARNMVAAVRAINSTLEVWAGEIGPHNGGDFPNPNCASNRVCGRWGSALWYADAMASVAKEGYSAFCRQDFLGADYGLVNYTSFAPSPDWWELVLWQRLVGTAVLDAHHITRAPSLRTYAYCAPAHSPAYATLVLINLDNVATCVLLPTDAVPSVNATQWSLTGGDGGSVESAEVLLNGARLELDADGHIAPTSLDGRDFFPSAPLSLPPASVTFVSYATNLAACA